MGLSRQEYWSGLPPLLQGIFPTQGLNPGFLHCRQILYHLSHLESPPGHWKRTSFPLPRVVAPTQLMQRWESKDSFPQTSVCPTSWSMLRILSPELSLFQLYFFPPSNSTWKSGPVTYKNRWNLWSFLRIHLEKEKHKSSESGRWKPWGCCQKRDTAAAKSLQSCLTLCDPIDSSSPGSPVPGIPQARTLEWVRERQETRDPKDKYLCSHYSPYGTVSILKFSLD